MRADFGEQGLMSAYLEEEKKATYFFSRSKTIMKSTFGSETKFPKDSRVLS